MSHSAPTDAPLKSLKSNVRKLWFSTSVSPDSRASSPRTVKYPTVKLRVCWAAAGSAISALKSVSAASSAPSRPEIADHAQHLLMKPIVGGDEVSGGGVERRAVHAGDSSCRLLHDQRTGGHVPGLEMLFPEAVE